MYFTKLTKFFILLAFTLAFVIVIKSISIIKNDIYDILIQETSQFHNISQHRLEEFKEDENSFFKTLQEYSAEFYFKNNKLQNISHIAHHYELITKIKPNIMQLRFIDATGKEVIRVDKDKKGVVKLIKSDKLQDKSNRYYVQEFLKLQDKEIGYSSFDLNIENEKIEIPFNPTLRMGTAIYKNNKLHGIIVANYYMDNWLQYFINNSTSNISLVDHEGYFLKHYDENWSWSRYIKNPKTIKEYLGIDKFSIQGKDFYKLTDNAIGHEMQLFDKKILVVYESKKPIKEIITEKIMVFSLIFSSVIFIIMAPILYLLYNKNKELKKLHTKTEDNNNFLETILNNTFEGLIITDQFGTVEKSNEVAQKIFGYENDQMQGIDIRILIPEPRKNRDDYIKNAQQSNAILINRERGIKGICKDGMEVPISISITKVKIEEDFHFVISTEDLRELYSLENDRKKQENIILHQSKLASMGEMIGAIAHQWRQPLNELAIRIQKLKYKYAKDEIDAIYVEDFIIKNRNTIEFMSKTIDNFRNFFRIDKMKREFNVKETVEEVINIQDAQLKNCHIAVTLEGDDFSYTGYKSEFQQVILNIISNSKDAFVSNSIQNAVIKIKLSDHKITIEDNAGGIPQDIIQRVFEPYFTTKEQGQGTGMGLYMSKMIIEDNMNGKILIENKNNGVEFTIELDKSK